MSRFLKMAQPGAQVERVTGFDCEFVDPPPEVLQSECPVCLLIIRDPHQVTCCGNSFCHYCICRIKTNNMPCPTCNEGGFSDFPDKRLKRSLYAFKVHCSYQTNGCQWTGELGQIDKHLNTDPQPEKQLDGCQFVEVYCIHECGDQLQRRYIQTHQTEHCTKRPFSCEHCHDYKSDFDDVIHSHWLVCWSFPLHCPNECGLKVQRQNIDSHVADECPLTTISCDFLHIGCAVKLPRKDMPEHLRETFLTHISLLASNQVKVQFQIASLIAENKELKSENTNLKHNITELQDEVASLTLNTKSTLKKQYKTRDDFQDDQDYGCYVKATLKPGMKVRARVTCGDVTKGDFGTYRQPTRGHAQAQFMWEGFGKYYAYWHQVELVPSSEEQEEREDTGIVATPTTSPHTTTPPVLTPPAVSRTTTPPVLTPPAVSRTTTPPVLTPPAVSRTTTPPVLTPPAVSRTYTHLGPSVLTMTNFQQHKRDEDSWFSPPVYTRGYKICLRVHANGCGGGTGTHVSVGVHFMRGEFDHDLRWPFCGVVSFQLLDQINGRDHARDLIAYDGAKDYKVCSRVTEGERAEYGYGATKFIAHTELVPKYLQNDTLLFQVQSTYQSRVL